MGLFDRVDVPDALEGLFDPQAATLLLVATAVLIIVLLAVLLVRQAH